MQQTGDYAVIECVNVDSMFTAKKNHLLLGRAVVKTTTVGLGNSPLVTASRPRMAQQTVLHLFIALLAEICKPKINFARK